MNITDMLNEGMKSMELPKKTKKEEMAVCCPSPEMEDSGPRYPYGLEIRMNDEVLKLVGKGTDDFTINKKMTIVAEVEVTEIRSSVGKKEYNNNQSVEMQITDMKFVDPMAESKDNKSSHNSGHSDSY